MNFFAMFIIRIGYLYTGSVLLMDIVYFGPLLNGQFSRG